MLSFLNNSKSKEKYQKFLDNKNYGLTEIQIISLTNKINKLHNHCILNKKDFHNKRGLILNVSKRKKLLIFLKKISLSRYNELILFLKLRK